jgi:hypothetical protein
MHHKSAYGPIDGERKCEAEKVITFAVNPDRVTSTAMAVFQQNCYQNDGAFARAGAASAAIDTSV